MLQPIVKIIKYDVDWREIKNMARTTIGMDDSLQEPNQEWKRKILIAEHSVIRHSLITVEIDNIPFYVMGHFVRHSVGVTPYVKTSREDRTGVPRSERRQTDLVDMRIDLNIQSLINISRKRLCNQADATTQKIWWMVLREIAKIDEDVVFTCTPEGVRMAGCPECFSNCCACENFISTMGFEERQNLMKRYEKYDVKSRALKKEFNTVQYRGDK